PGNVSSGAIGQHRRASHGCRAFFHFTRSREQDQQCTSAHCSRNDYGTHIGIGKVQRRRSSRARRSDKPLHSSTLSFSNGRCPSDEFPLAAFNFANAGERFCRPRLFAWRVRGSNSPTVSLLQLRRLHADPVTFPLPLPLESSSIKTKAAEAEEEEDCE